VIESLLLATLAAARAGGEGETRRAKLVRVLGQVGWRAEAFQSVHYAALQRPVYQTVEGRA
jgi:hypothetical protein